VVLDVWSRRLIGWSLGRDLTAKPTLAALRMALEQRRPRPGLIPHSGRGGQYASSQYVALLEERGAEISMSRPGNPYDNACCESFIAS